MTREGPTHVRAITEQVRAILASVGARPDMTAVTDTESLLNSGVIDSMAMVNLVTALEQRFRIAIGDTELVPEHFDSVEAIAAFIRGKTGTT
jgi:acyl carrier protein